MNTRDQIFRHSFRKIYLVTTLLFGIVALILAITETTYILLGFLALLIPISIYYSTKTVSISREEITTKNWFGSKSLHWNDIAHISMRSQNLRLHNSSEDTILSIDAQMDNYEEILDFIYKKHPDLFDADNQNTMTVGTTAIIALIGLGLFFISTPILFFISEEEDWYYGLILAVMGVWFLIAFLLSPKGVTLENGNIHIKYLFRETLYPAREIEHISLIKTRTRDGYVYYVRVKPKSRKPIKLSTFKPGSIMTYFILKRWHERATTNRSVPFP